MHTFTWMKKGSTGESVQKAWMADPLLPADSGGSLAEATNQGVSLHEETLRTGGRYLALGCLTWLNHEFSLHCIKYNGNRIEGLGHHL